MKSLLNKKSIPVIALVAGFWALYLDQLVVGFALVIFTFAAFALTISRD